MPLQKYEKDNESLYIETEERSGRGDPLAQSNAHKFVSNPVWKVSIDVERHPEVKVIVARSTEVRRCFITAPAVTMLIAIGSETSDHEAPEE